VFEFSADAGLWGLLASSFVSATILPGSSELVLIGLLAKYPALFWQAIAVATIGNTLGGMTSYALGRFIPNRVLEKTEGRAHAWLKKYGPWSLLLSWVPLIGDALCVGAGWLRFNVWVSLALIAAGKLARYWVIAGGWAWFSLTFLK
jgi:membrane protein YqaA with SNARE-associated domain